MLTRMRTAGVARGNIARRARSGLRWSALSWLVGALGTGCGADASEGVDGDGTTESVGALSPAQAPNAPAASSSEPPASGSSSAPAPAGPNELAAPSIPITAPPSEEPSALPHAALDTPRSLDRLAPAEVVIEPGDCRFEFLGEWVRCENAGWPNTLQTDAPDLVTCMRQCLERDDCTAVTDYLWMDLPDLGCYLYLSTCDEPALETAWGEEDGGRDFRRNCDAPSGD
jgi:hypothetical protein